MQEVVRAIEDNISNEIPRVSFTDTAKKWAAYCLETYRDELLKRGLAIAAALAEFEDEIGE